MKKLTLKLLSVFAIITFFSFIFNYEDNDNYSLSRNNDNSFVYEQVSLEANNIRAWIWNSGIFDQDLRTNNTPGFIWPKSTSHAAVFTAGLTIACYINNQLRIAAASYRGEYRPGYCINGTFITNTNFKLYKVTRGDNSINNPDWENWGLMVPYGAPFEDINNNGIYEPNIDKAGVKGSAQTVFVCLTDADPTTHSSSEGFGGGTAPLGAEAHLTAWCYDNPEYQDMQFFKWVVINKNNTAWDSVMFSITADPDLGDPYDDYIGCDTVRNLSYCYNADNQDGNGMGLTYGTNPPAIGFRFLDCNISNSLRLSSTCHWRSNSPLCEREPGTTLMAYNFMKGLKNDATPWVIPFTNPPRPTTFNYSGDPETQTGWTEYTGKLDNCGGILIGNTIAPSPAGERKIVMSTHTISQRMNPGDTQVVQIAQLIARGSNNLNSVTLLKQLSDVAKHLCENNFVIGINPISSEVPKSFSLSQNYPNPFNPSTKIRFEIPSGKSVAQTFLSVYNALGQEITTLVNEHLKPGIYSVDWNAANYPSGVYFYKLSAGDFSETKKMVLIK